MKKLFVLMLVVVLSFTFTSFAETIDLSGMSYAELVALKDQINLAIWNSQEWQEVTVPQGVWKVGEDIPAGHWTVAALGANTTVSYGNKLDESGKKIAYNSTVIFRKQIHNPDAVVSFDPNFHLSQVDIDVSDGMYIVIDGGQVVFTPYSGKPSLGFK